jgi:ParB/RepB/Spo0J family partition protein
MLDAIALARQGAQRHKKDNDEVKVSGGSVEIQRDKLHPLPNQPRNEITDENIARMRESLKTKGQLQNILVRPHPTINGEYQIVIGETRWRGSKPGRDWKGLPHLRAEIRELNDVQAFLIALAENRDREDLTAYDEVKAVARLIEEFNMSVADVQKHLGEGRGWVDNRFYASKLEPEIMEQLKKPDSLSKALEIGKAPNTKLRNELNANFDTLTVQEIKHRIDEWKLRNAPHLASVPKRATESTPELFTDRPAGYEPPDQYRASGYESNTGITTSRTPASERFIQSQGSRKVYGAPEVLPSALPVMLERTEEGLQYFAQQYERLSSNGSYDVLTQNQMLTRLENILRYAEAGIEAIQEGQQGKRKR